MLLIFLSTINMGKWRFINDMHSRPTYLLFLLLIGKVAEIGGRLINAEAISKLYP